MSTILVDFKKRKTSQVFIIYKIENCVKKINTLVGLQQRASNSMVSTT